MIKSKIFKETGNKIELTISSWDELEKLIESKEIDFCEFCMAREVFRRRGLKEPENTPSLEILYRRLGFRTEFSEKVLADWATPIKGFPPTADDETKLPPAELVASLDGWTDRQRMADSIKAHMDIEKAREYASEHGRIFREELIEFLESQLAHWTHRTEDVPFTYNPPAGLEPQSIVVHENRQRRKTCAEREAIIDSYNFEFHAALTQISGQAIDTAQGVEPYGDIIADPYGVKIYPYQSRDQMPVPRMQEPERPHNAATTADVRASVAEFRAAAAKLASRATRDEAEIAKGVEEVRAKMAAMKAAPNGLKQKAAEMVKKKGR